MSSLSNTFVDLFGILFLGYGMAAQTKRALGGIQFLIANLCYGKTFSFIFWVYVVRKTKSHSVIGWPQTHGASPVSFHF